MKICSKCHIEKSLDEFYNHKYSSDGKRSACKICTNADNKEWYLRNKEEYDEWRNLYKLKDKENQNARVKTWTENNSERKKASEKQWREDNPEKIATKNHNWYIENREKNYGKTLKTIKNA